MQVIIATSRSINQDRFYQVQQKKKFEIHMRKIKNLTSSKLNLQQDIQIYKNNLRKAKSAAKLFQQQQQKNFRRIQNKVLLTKLINVQPTIKTMRVKASSKDKMLSTTSSNWINKKNEQQKIKKQNQILQKRYKALSQTNVKDFKKKIQQEIKQYLELKNQIRKIKPNRLQFSSKSQRSKSVKKLSMNLNLPYVLNEEQAIKLSNTDKATKNFEQKMQNKLENQKNNENDKKIVENEEKKLPLISSNQIKVEK